MLDQLESYLIERSIELNIPGAFYIKSHYETYQYYHIMYDGLDDGRESIAIFALFTDRVEILVVTQLMRIILEKYPDFIILNL